MKTNHFVVLAKLFCYCASESKIEEVLKELSSLETFKDRIDLAEKELKHLSSGGSRIIYVMDNGEVLKLAKNEKGLAQNKAESNPDIKSQYINKTIKSDKDGVWKTSPYLDKVTEKQFEELCGIGFKDFGKAISWGLKSVSSSDKSDEKKPEGMEDVWKSDIYKELVEVGKKFDLMPGDLERISSWGTDGKVPVLLDTGLKLDIWNKYYE